MVAKYKQGMVRDSERAVDFLGEAFPKRNPSWRIEKFKTGSDLVIQEKI